MSTMTPRAIRGFADELTKGAAAKPRKWSAPASAARAGAAGIGVGSSSIQQGVKQVMRSITESMPRSSERPNVLGSARQSWGEWIQEQRRIDRQQAQDRAIRRANELRQRKLR